MTTSPIAGSSQLSATLAALGTTALGQTRNDLLKQAIVAVANSPGSGGSVWGDITGTLSNQTDLQAALDAKLSLTGGTMTGALIVGLTALGTTPTAAASFVNSTAAAAGAQQSSPSLLWEGQGWKTNATAASQKVQFRANVLPVQGSANPSGTWRLQSDINASGSWADVLCVTSGGQLQAKVGSSSSPGISFDSATTTGFTITASQLSLCQNGSEMIRFGFSVATFLAGVDIATSTATGTRIGQTSAQKVGFWGATAVVQPGTGTTPASFSANTSGILDDSATWDGYTIGAVVGALRLIGILT